jgi:hypothetical protein
MGRGLSPLQRYIVAKAATVDRLYYHEIFVDYYGWKSHRKRSHNRDGIYSPGDQRFWPAEIGKQRYHATRVALSRATDRLAQRGLVTCLCGARSHWSAVEITPEGRRLAASWPQPVVASS